ncbi:MAG: hypothetical protein AAB534_01030 [Patescibacteria group bacterium]
MESTKLNGEKILDDRRGKWPQRLPVAMLAGAIFGLSAACIVFSQLTFETSSKLGPRAMIERCQWFEDTAAEIYKKQRDILIYESFLKSMRDSFGDNPQTQWAINQLSSWSHEMEAIKKEQDVLASVFNAEMTDANWKLVSEIEGQKAKVKAIPRQFTVYHALPPPTKPQ